MADPVCPGDCLRHATVKGAIEDASVSAERLLQVIDLIEVCRRAVSVAVIKDVCDRVAVLLTAETALGCCADRSQDCNFLVSSTATANVNDSNLKLYLKKRQPCGCEGQTLQLNRSEKIQLTLWPHQLHFSYFSDEDQTGICLMLAQHQIHHDFGSYMPLVYLLPHIHALYKRICGQPDQYENRLPTEATTLTPREMDVLRWIAAGKTNWEISRIMNLSERTVKFHLANVFEKLKAVNRTHAVVKARAIGVLVE